MGIHRTMIGGQAVIEGVMMRGVKSASMAVRKPDGEIDIQTWELASMRDQLSILKLPILRGVVNFIEMLIFGYKCITKSAEIAGVDEEPDKDKKASKDECEAISSENAEAEVKTETKKKDEKDDSKLMSFLMILSMLVGVVIAVLLFTVSPMMIVYKLPLGGFKTITEGIIRIVIFIAYLLLVSRMKDIKRIFEYHGAEHKTIFCYEHGDELTVENARKYGRLHPRCGTSFLLIVLIISILVFSLPFVPWNSVPLRILYHLLLLPIVVGISYEIIKFAGRHDNSVMRFLLAPGLWLQKITTREPDDSQLEVAIQSLSAVLTGNREDDKW